MITRPPTRCSIAWRAREGNVDEELTQISRRSRVLLSEAVETLRTGPKSSERTNKSLCVSLNVLDSSSICTK